MSSNVSSVKIIGVSGKIGSGKDHIVKNYLLPAFDKSKEKCMVLSFADFLKEYCAMVYDLNYHELYQQKNKNSRKILQRTGTELRKKHGPHTFVNIVHQKIQDLACRNGFSVFILTDVRFPEELNFVRKNNGFLCRVESKSRNSRKLQKECSSDKKKILEFSTHESEVALDKHTAYDFILHNEENCDVQNECSKMIHKCNQHFQKSTKGLSS